MTARVLVLNAGSSSLKYRLLDGVTGAAEASGTVERIGEDSGTLTHSVDGEDHTEERRIADFDEALRSALDAFERHGPPIDEGVVDEDRGGEARAAVHDAVPHRPQGYVGECGAVRVEGVERRPQGVGVGGDLLLGRRLARGPPVGEPPLRLTDLLDEARGGHVTGGGVDEGVLQRGRAGVDHQHEVSHAGHRRAAPGSP